MITPNLPSIPEIGLAQKQEEPTQEQEQPTEATPQTTRRSALMKQLLNDGNSLDTNTNEQVSNDISTMPASGSLGDMDMVKQLPKLSAGQIMKAIQNTSFKNSSAWNNQSAAQGIFNAQQKTGLSALAIMGIAALESGWGGSNIGKAKGNYWGYGAINSNPMGGAHSYGGLEGGATSFANEFLKDYYNGYGAKTINMVGTGNNPAGKGYAYYDGGGINKSWATNITNLMNTIYNAAR